MTDSDLSEATSDRVSSRGNFCGGRPWMAYVLAAAATAVATLLRWVLIAAFGDMPLFITFYPAVALVAMLLGARAAVLATILSVLEVDCFSLPPPGSLKLTSLHDAAALGSFAATGLLISFMAGLLERARRRQAARERESLLRAMSEGIPDPLFIKDRDSRIVIANAATLRAVGKPAGQIIGHTDAEFHDDPAVAQAIMANDQQVMKSGRPEVIEEFVPGAEGGRTFLSIKTPWRDAEGRIIGVIGCARDITDRKRMEETLRESEARFQVLAAGTFEGIAISESGRMTDVNEQLARMLGYEPAELIGMKIEDILPPEARESVLANIRAGAESHVEHDLVRKDGRRVTVEAHGRNITYQNRSVRITAVHDISERKLVEHALRRYELLANGSRDIILFIDRDSGQILEANAAAEMAYGYNREELTALTLYDLRANKEIPAKLWAEVDANGALFETVHRRRDGSTFPVEVSSRGATIEGRRVFISMVRDIAERKHAEEALRRSEARLRAIFEQAAVGTAVADPATGQFLQVNPRYCEITGYESSELLGMTFMDVTHPEDRLTDRDKYDRVATGQAREYLAEKRYVRKDGRVIWVQVAVGMVRDPQGRAVQSVGVIQDITERKRWQEALQESEERLRATFDNAALGIVEVDSQDRFIAANNTACRILGYRREELLAMTVHELTYPEDRPSSDEINAQLHEGRFGMFEREKRYLKRDGSPLWVHVTVSAIRDSAGRYVRGIGTFEDITERKRAEEALADEKRFVEVLFASLPANIFVFDRNGRCVRWNDYCIKVLGWSEDDMRDLGICDMVALRDRQRCELAFREALLNGHAEVELVGLAKDGREVPFYFNTIRAELAGEAYVVAVGIDISDRKQAEQRLQELNATLETRVAERTAEAEHRAAQLQRLAAQLTQVEQQERQQLATLLHDHLQQLLVGAKFRLSTLRNQPLHERYIQSLRQADELIDASLKTSRSLTAELSPPILHEGTLAQVMHWLARSAKEKYGLTVLVSAEEEADLRVPEMRFLIFQAIRELLLNVAKHAKVDRASITLSPKGPDRVQVVVADEGVGFDWTHKSAEAAEGEPDAGLGLFSIRERLELMGGSMEIDSQPGQGARITLTAACLLLAGAMPAERTAGQTPAGRPPGQAVPCKPQDRNAIRVLLADDHEVVRTGLARLLQTEPDIEIAGQAADGQEAVEVAFQIQPDVILMDVSMPRMSGEEATRRIVQQMPSIKIIGLSMHEQEDVAASMKAAGAAMYLTKTSPPESLVAAIRGCIARAAVVE